MCCPGSHSTSQKQLPNSSPACLHCSPDSVLCSASLQVLLNWLPPATSAWRATKRFHHLSAQLLSSLQIHRSVLAPGCALQISEVRGDCTFLLVFNPHLETLDLPEDICNDAGVLVDVVGDVLQVAFCLVSKNT